MQIQGVSHIGLGVKDLGRSIKFYRDVLGLPMVHEMMGYDEAPGILRYPHEPRRDAVYFRVGEGARSTVLVIGTVHRSNRSTPLLLDELGIHHFSFWVDDIEALRRRLGDAGAEILMEPIRAAEYHVDQSDDRRGGPCSTMFFRDPDGFMLQADQRVPLGTASVTSAAEPLVVPTD